MIDDDKADDTSKASDAQLLEEMREFRQTASAYWDPIYQQGREDKEFVTIKGAQWNSIAAAQRKTDGLPVLEFNLVRTYCRQQINTMRQNRPQATVAPVDSGADVETAKILQGLIKDTETATDFEGAFDMAAENAVYGAMGFWRIGTDYVSPDSFQQQAKFMPIANSEAVYIDPLSKALDGSDMTRAIVVEWIDKEKCEKEYGEDACKDFDGISDAGMWSNLTDNTVAVAEYFWIDEEQADLALLPDGSTAWVSELPKGVVPAKTRKSAKRTVQWCKATGAKIVERGRFPSEFIPIIPFYGEVTWIANDRHVFSLVHFAKDPQRLFNYWKSTEAHQLAEMVDTPWVASAESIESLEEEWGNPKGRKVLRYNALDTSGRQITAPQRQSFSGSPTGVLNAAMGAQQSITDILNMHAPVMGAQGNETSGVAIRTRQTQSETAQFHFQDNGNKSICHSARILLSIYREIYDVKMVKRIIGNDGEPTMTNINQPAPPDADPESVSINGLLNDLSVGRYDIRMDTGPSFNTQREQSFAAMSELIRGNPNMLQVFGDLWLKDAPLVNAKEISQRLAATIPPEIKGATEKKGANAEVEQVMQQAQAQMQQLQQQLQQAMAAADDKQAERDLKMEIELLKAQTSLRLAEINNGSKADIAELQGAVQMLLQNMQPPTDWLDPNEPEPPEPNQHEMNQPADQAGFFMPEPTPEFNALNNGQIESDAPMTAEMMQADLSPPNDMQEM